MNILPIHRSRQGKDYGASHFEDTERKRFTYHILPLIQEGQLSVSIERMCTILDTV